MRFFACIFFGLALFSVASIVNGEERAWREMPKHLKGYEKEYAESPRKASLAWFQDSRFGLFIHWGPSAGIGRGMWAMYNERIPVEEYEKIVRGFKGDRFDAQAFVDLALKAKMKYITFVAKHHDGFALWDSSASGYDSMDFPSHRDFLGELAAACHKAGLGLFVYYSIGIDWHHPYFLPNTMYDPARPHYRTLPSQYRYRAPEDFRHYMNFAKTQLTEICTKYGPLAGIWFDTIGGVYQHPDIFRIQEVYDLIHAIQPHALVIFKTGATGTEDAITGEREMGSLSGVFRSVGLPVSVQEAADRAWEANKAKPAELNIPIQTIGWAYISSPRQRQKGPGEVKQLLQQCANMRANLLLNIGPKPDGAILEENIKTLTEIGKWIEKEGFPKPVDGDFMRHRTKAPPKLDVEEANRTAR